MPPRLRYRRGGQMGSNKAILFCRLVLVFGDLAPGDRDLASCGWPCHGGPLHVLAANRDFRHLVEVYRLSQLRIGSDEGCMCMYFKESTIYSDQLQSTMLRVRGTRSKVGNYMQELSKP